MHVKEEIIERITLMNDYLEPYEDMAMILVHLLLLTVSHMNHVHLLLEQNISHIVFLKLSNHLMYNQVILHLGLVSQAELNSLLCISMIFMAIS